MEIRFDRDLRHNYMVLCGLTTGEDYRWKMLSENTPKGLLKCSLRSINGAGYLYYEIDSRQPMRNRFSDGTLRHEELDRLLRDMTALEETLEEYLLEVDQILFSPDCVYYDMRTGGFYFVYCPFPEGSETEREGYTFASFTEELLGFLDPDDEQAATMAYRLCELAGHEEIRVTDAVSTVREEAGIPSASGETGEQRRNDHPEGYPGEREIFIPGERNPPAEHGGGSVIPLVTDPVRETDYAAVLAAMDAEETGQSNGGGGKKGTIPILLVLFLAVFAGNLVIRSCFRLDARENLLSLAVAGVSLVMALILLVLMIRAGLQKEEDTDGSRAESAGKKRKREDDRETDWVRPVCEEAEVVGAVERDEGRSAGYRQSRAREMRYEAASEEETTVLSEAEAAAWDISRLYGRNGAETINIDLGRLPLTVGKMSGCADYVLPDESVSRMHVRFAGDGSGKATEMQDLNSTNGTWLNGRRLKPNETVSIRAGDEIGIGRLRFELR